MSVSLLLTNESLWIRKKLGCGGVFCCHCYNKNCDYLFRAWNITMKLGFYAAEKEYWKI